MKTSIVILLLFVSAFKSKAQDFSTFTKLFEKASLPYTVPDGAYTEYQSEEGGSPSYGKTIDNSLAVAFCEAAEDGYDQFEAVARIEQANYVGFVIFITSINFNDGQVSGSYYLYNMTKTGEYISSRPIGEEGSWQDGDVYVTSKTSAVISVCDMADDEGKLLITYKDSREKNKIDAKYGIIQETITTLFDLIEKDGNINSVTNRFD